MKGIIEFLSEYWVMVYLIFVSSLAFVITVYDKFAAKKLPQHRTPEKTLLFISAVGGSVAMLVTMLIIRHKTKHVKFMLGIPVIILVQLAFVFALLHFGIIKL